MRLNTNFSIKDAAVCLNASNLWIETWRVEGEPPKGKMKRVYLKEIRVALLESLKFMFGKDHPPLRQDLEQIVKETKFIEDCMFVTNRFMEVYCYLLSASQDHYIAVHKDAYKMWRKEEDEIRTNDPSDFIFI
jgi:hypothetical protein